MKYIKWPLYTGGIGAAAIFSVQASASVSLAHTASRMSSLFLSPTNHSAHPRLRLFSLPIQGFSPLCGGSLIMKTFRGI